MSPGRRQTTEAEDLAELLHRLGAWARTTEDPDRIRRARVYADRVRLELQDARTDDRA